MRVLAVAELKRRHSPKTVAEVMAEHSGSIAEAIAGRSAAIADALAERAATAAEEENLRREAPA